MERRILASENDVIGIVGEKGAIVWKSQEKRYPQVASQENFDRFWQFARKSAHQINGKVRREITEKCLNPGVEIVKNQEKGLCPDCRQSGHGYILIYKSRKLRSFTNIVFWKFFLWKNIQRLDKEKEIKKLPGKGADCSVFILLGYRIHAALLQRKWPTAYQICRHPDRWSVYRMRLLFWVCFHSDPRSM